MQPAKLFRLALHLPLPLQSSAVDIDGVPRNRAQDSWQTNSAVLVLLQCYETGRGVQEDKQEAVRLYEAAAEKVQPKPLSWRLGLHGQTSMLVPHVFVIVDGFEPPNSAVVSQKSRSTVRLRRDGKETRTSQLRRSARGRML